jgi:hypothetical protein
MFLEFLAFFCMGVSHETNTGEQYTEHCIFTLVQTVKYGLVVDAVFSTLMLMSCTFLFGILQE